MVKSACPSPTRFLIHSLFLSGIALLSTACTPEQPPFVFNQLETLVMDRPDAAAVVCRFKTYAPCDTVWQRIATGAGLERWAADSAAVELKGGGRYTMVLPGGLRLSHPVRSFVPGKKLTYEGEMKGTWVTWQLEKLHHGTRVTFASNGISEEWRERIAQHKEPAGAFVQTLVTHLAQQFPGQ
jgi:uncharacterized protein YndB with AHSA1/START domain